MLATFYPWIKAFHIMAVIAWMAGLFYLPRLFVHHVEQAKEDPSTKAVFEMMELKLLRVIMNPSMILTWILGVFLAVLLDHSLLFSKVWFWAKFVAVLLMTGFHMWLARKRKALAAGTDRTSGRTYRIVNEVPTVLMLVIVVMVVVKPF